MKDKAKSRLHSRILKVMFVGWVFLQVFICEPVLRESDQASILHGANEISNGNFSSVADYYNFDKQFMSYAIVGVVLNIFSSYDVVYIGNLMCLLVLVSALSIVLLKFERINLKISIVWYCVLFSPVMLLSAPFLSTNLLSIAVLLVLVLLLRYYKPSFKGRLLLFTCSFVAVGCRADAVLVFPFLVWLTLQNKANVRAILKSEIVWIMMSAVICVWALGKFFKPVNPENMYPIFLEPKAWVCFLLFTATPIVLCLLDLCITMLRDKRLNIESRLVGILALLLPFFFYLPILCSPRHLILNIVILLAAMFLYRKYTEDDRGKWGSWHRLLSITSIIGMLFLGIRINDQGEFRLTTVGSGELFPTADGAWSMGGVAYFLFDLKGSTDTPVDHNMKIWNDLNKVKEVYSSNQTTYLLRNQMQSYHILLASIKGGKIQIVDEIENKENGLDYYFTSRSLLKKMPHVNYSYLEKSIGLAKGEGRLQCINPKSDYRLYHISPDLDSFRRIGDIKKLNLDWVLGDVFARNDYVKVDVVNFKDLETKKYKYIVISDNENQEFTRARGFRSIENLRGKLIYVLGNNVNNTNFEMKGYGIYRSAYPRMMLSK